MIWGILGGVLLSLLASELYDSCPRLTILLLRAASRRLPAECRDRYWEEWMGELDAQGDLGKLQRLGWAFWVFLSGWQTGRTLQRAIEEVKHSALTHQQESKKGDELVKREILTIEDLVRLSQEGLRKAAFPGIQVQEIQVQGRVGERHIV